MTSDAYSHVFSSLVRFLTEAEIEHATKEITASAHVLHRAKHMRV